MAWPSAIALLECYLHMSIVALDIDWWVRHQEFPRRDVLPERVDPYAEW